MNRYVFLLLVTSHSALAQFTVRGTVIDSATSAGIEYATLTLLDELSHKPVNGTVTDLQGRFVLTGVARGKWQLIASFIGYRNKELTLVVDADYTTKTIALGSAAKILKEIVVEGQAALVEEKVDRTIYHASQDNTTKGGDASDVLKRVPMLTVDQDGNVALRGSTNVKVLINNKPSTISANSVADALRQIPADMIATVEVITSPSSRYDAEGSGGIVNIVLKKNSLEGEFFTSDLSAGSRGSSAGMTVSRRKGKNGLSATGFYRPSYNILADYSNRQLTRSSDTVLTLQSARNRSAGYQATAGLVWDYDFSVHNSLSATVRIGERSVNSWQDNLSTRSYRHESLTSESLQNIVSTAKGHSVDGSLTYVKRFSKKDRELNFLGVYSRNAQTNGYTIATVETTDNSVPNFNKNSNPGFTEESVLQLDYQEPLGNDNLLEMGAKTTLRNVRSDYNYFIADSPGDLWLSDPNHSSTGFHYRQQISAAYLTYGFTFKGITVKAGSRYEYTTIQAHFNGKPDITIPSYGVMVPAVNLSKKLKNGNLIKVAYNKRIQRPGLRDLNPNLQASNLKNATQGNPNLKPEYTDLAEIGYRTGLGAATINLSLFMRYNTNDIQPARIIRHDTIIAISQNIGTEANYGVSFFVTVPLSDHLTLNGGSDSFYRILKNNSNDVVLHTSNRGFTPNFKMSASYDLGKSWSAQFFGTYQGRSFNLQGYRTSPISHSASVRKDIFGKNGSLVVGVDNFLTPAYRTYANLNSPYLTQSTTTTLHNFIVKASFSYKIGKVIQNKKKQLSEDEREN